MNPWKEEALKMIERHTGGAEIDHIEEYPASIEVFTKDGRNIKVMMSEPSGFANRRQAAYLYMKEKTGGKWKRIKTK